jgi:hypothetical protein
MHWEELYDVYDCPWDVSELNEKLSRWKYVCNNSG